MLTTIDQTESICEVDSEPDLSGFRSILTSLFSSFLRFCFISQPLLTNTIRLWQEKQDL